MADAKKPLTFHERYASDSEFRRKIEEQRRSAAVRRSENALKDALDMIRGVPGSPKKYY